MIFIKEINVKLLLQLLILQEFVIITTTFSGVFLLVSYVALTGTTKVIPSEMLTLGIALISGASAAALKKGKLSNAEMVISTQSLRDYAFMGAATTELILAANYVFLIWLEKLIPGEIAPAIGSLAAVVLGFTDFGSSKNKDE
ncbi:hypothetical protein [Microcoleus sp. Pol12B5]|uniref:hypothetical protein n=1 Tax=Microcoleus sp. Pol12B5 TaxID=3055396 RepID=UPI002FD34A41